MTVWTYKRTNKKYNGTVVYERYMFDEFMGYGYKTRIKQLKQHRDKQGNKYNKEVNAGWECKQFDRMYKDNEGNIKLLSWDQLAKDFY